MAAAGPVTNTAGSRASLPDTLLEDDVEECKDTDAADNGPTTTEDADPPTLTENRLEHSTSIPNNESSKQDESPLPTVEKEDTDTYDDNASSSYLRKSIDVEDIDVPISTDDLMRSLDAELDKRRPDTYIITQLCRDLGQIPTKWRARVWKELLCPGGIKAELPWDVISMMEQDDPNQRVIRADAPRTRAKDFPASSREAVERTLVHLLTYYCKCKNIRYKQGMNEVLAPFLLLRGDPSSAWTDAVVYQCFYTFIDKYLTNVFSDREFRSLQCSMRLLRLLLQYHDPILCAHLDQHDMSPELYVTPWFMTFFTRNESPELVFALWDTVLLADDPCLLHFFALALLEDSRDRVMDADVAELPQVLARLTITSVAHVEKLTAVAQNRLANTPASFRKDVMLVCHRPLTDRSLPSLRQMGAAPCLNVHPQEVVAHMVSKIQTNHAPNGLALLVLDCRPFSSFQEFHFSLSYHIDPDVLASPEAFNVLLDGFGRMKDCHFCFLGDASAQQRVSPDDPPTCANGPASPSGDSDMHVTRFVLLFLQHGFQHVSKVQGGVEALRAEVAAHVDADVQDQLTVGEWNGSDDPNSLKAKARKLLLGKLPTLTQRFRGAIKPFVKKPQAGSVGDGEGGGGGGATTTTTQGPLVDEDEWVEVVVRSKEVLKRTSSSSAIAPTKQVLFGPGKLGILFKGIDKSPITVDSVVPKGQADLTNQVERGDVLIAVAGQSVRGMKFHHVMDLLHAVDRPMTLEFSHPSTRHLDVLDALSVPPHAPAMLRNGPYSISLLWDAVAGASRYQLQFAMQSEHRFHPWATVAVKNRTAGGVGLLDHVAAPAETAGTLVGLEPNEKYLVRLRCGTDTTWGVYSEASAVLATLPLDTPSRKLPTQPLSPRAAPPSSSVVFLAGECPDVVELGLFYYRVLIGLRARSGPSYEAPTVEVALDKGSLIKCEEKVTRGPYVFVRLQDTDLWAFETTVDNAAVLERLAYDDRADVAAKLVDSTKTVAAPTLQPQAPPPQQPSLVAPSGLAVQAPTTSSLVVSWEALLDPFVVRYQLQYSKNSFGAMWASKDVSSQLNTCVLTQLSPGTPYVVRIRAGYESTWGPYSSKSAAVKTLDDDPPVKSSSNPKFFNSFVERAAETAAVAARTVSARLARTASQDNMDEAAMTKEMMDLPSLVVNVEEMKAASAEFQWFAAQKVVGDLEWTCDLVVSHGYVMAICPEADRPGWGRVEDKRQLKLLSKITSKRGLQTSVVFHFKKQEGSDDQDIETLEFLIHDRQGCLQLVKERFLAITAKPGP